MSDAAGPLHHICSRDAWNHARLAGHYQADSLLTEGFIHLSTPAQLAETGRRHYAGRTDLVVLTVDAARLRWEVRWEESRPGARFPHLYGPLNLDAVMSAQTFET